MDGEKGQALPLAILALTIGALVVAPFLGHAGSSLIGSRTYAEAIGQLDASDAGVEHAIWSLTRGSLAQELAAPGDEVTYQLDEAVNGFDVNVTVTANATGGDGTAGQITDSVIDSLEYDASNGYEPSIIQVSGNIFAIAYRGSGSNGFIKTVSIDTSGNINDSVIDSLEYDASNGYEPSIIHVSGDIYAIAYRGSGSNGFIRTVSIDGSGNINDSVIDSLEYDTSSGSEPSIIHVSGDIYAVAYRGNANRGYLKTVSIAANGAIGDSVTDGLEYDTVNGYEPSVVYVSGNVCAIAYRGNANRGCLKTVSIAANGDISNSVIDDLQFDSICYEPVIINVDNNVFAIAYQGSGNDGFIKTVAINADGDIGNSVIDTRAFTDYNCYALSIIHAANDIYAVAYRGQGNNGFLKTVPIAADGNIGDALIDTLEFDPSNCYEPAIIDVSGDIFAIVYRGPNNDGFVKTVAITSTGATAATYEIDASAGEWTIRAFINTDNTTVRVISWQIE
jgi:hypothetical protein